MNDKLLSGAEMATMQFCVRRMAVGAFGSLATIPLFCLREIEIPDIRSAINERYDVWRSCLVVIREILQSKPTLLKEAAVPLDALFTIAAELRNAYAELSDYDELPAEQILAAHPNLVSAFDRISPSIECLSNAIQVDFTEILTLLKGRRTYYSRTLQWIADEVHVKLGSFPNRGVSTSDSTHQPA